MEVLSQNLNISQFSRGRSRIRNLLARRPNNNSKSIGAPETPSQNYPSQGISQSRPTSRSSVSRGFSQASLNSPVFVDNSVPQTPTENNNNIFGGRSRERSVSVTRSASKTSVAANSHENNLRKKNGLYISQVLTTVKRH